MKRCRFRCSSLMRALIVSLVIWCGQAAVAWSQEVTGEARERFDHSNAVSTSRFWQDTGAAEGRENYLLDRGLYTSDRQTEGRSDQQNAGWTLGLGEASTYLALLDVSSRWLRTWGSHQVTFTLGLNASRYQGSTGYQDLEAQYLLAAQGTTPTRLPLASVNRSVEWGTVLGVQDSYRAAPGLELRWAAETRHNRYEIDQRRRDEAELNGGSIGWTKRWSRVNWDLNAQVNELRFRDLQTPVGSQQRRRQNLAAANSFLTTPLSARMRLGLGYQAYQSRFTDAPTRTVRGPALSLARLSDGRFAWEARVGWLQESGNIDRKGQALGSLNLSFRPSPRSNLVLVVSKEIDLLRYYQSYTADRLVLDAEQRSILQNSLQWDLQTGRSRWTLLLVQTEQHFAGVDVDNRSAQATLTHRLSRSSDLVQGAEYRVNREAAVGAALVERKVLKVSNGYRYRWGGGPRLLGLRPYASFDLSYESLLARAEAEAKFERVTFMLGVGQEFLL